MVTLAGLLGWNGVVLLLIGDRGTVIVQNSFFVGFANDFLPSCTAWILAIAGVALYAGMLFWQRAQRVAPRASPPHPMRCWRCVWWAWPSRSSRSCTCATRTAAFPYVLLMLAGVYIFWTYVLTRTRFGRHIYAVGGNAEAARRAGINVDNIKIACFAICSMMAALGGIVLASRLRSVDTGAGGGSILLYSIAAPVIGGTSLFGGRGNIKSAVLGALVIASIDNGLGLLGLSVGHEVRHHRRRAAAGGHGRLDRAQGARVGRQSVMAGGPPRPALRGGSAGLTPPPRKGARLASKEGWT